MDDIEDLSIDIYWSRSDEESAWSIELFPLLLLEQFNLFLRRYFLLELFTVLFDLLCHFVTHFLQFNRNLCSFLLYQFLKLFEVISFLSEANSLARITVDLIELKSQFYMDSNCPQMINHYLLHIDVLKSARVVDQLGLVIDSFLIRFEGLCSSSVGAWTDVVDSLWGNSSSD